MNKKKKKKGWKRQQTNELCRVDQTEDDEMGWRNAIF